MKNGTPTNTKRVEYLVQWKGFCKGEETWEPLSNLSTALELVREYNRLSKPITVADLLKKNSSNPDIIMTATKRTKQGSTKVSTKQTPPKDSSKKSTPKDSPKSKKYDPAEFSTFVPAVPGTKRKSTSIYAVMREDGSPYKSLQSVTSSASNESSNTPKMENGQAASPKKFKAPLRIQLKPLSKGARPLTVIKNKSTSEKTKTISKTQERARKVVSTILAKKTAKGSSSQKTKGKPHKKTPTNKTVTRKVTTKKVQQGTGTVQNSKSPRSQDGYETANGVTAGPFYGKPNNATPSVSKSKPSQAATAKNGTPKAANTPKVANKTATPKTNSTKKSQGKDKPIGKKKSQSVAKEQPDSNKLKSGVKVEPPEPSKSKSTKKTENNKTEVKKSEIKKKLVIKKVSIKKPETSKKNDKAKQTEFKKPAVKPKASIGKKRKAQELDSDSDSDNILYSLADDEQSSSGDDVSSSNSAQSTKKKLKLSLTPIDEKKDLTKMTCVVSPAVPVCAKTSGKRPPPKKMLLKDSIKSKSKSDERSRKYT